MEDNRPICDIKLNKDGSIPFESIANLDPNCRVPKAVKNVIIPMEGERDSVKNKKHTEIKTPEEVALHQEEVTMAQNESTKSTDIQVAEAQTPATVATVGVDQAVSQVKSLIPAGADASPALMIGGAAALAVVGAAIKFGPSVLKARAERAEREHEAKMKQLEIEEKKTEKQDDQHQQCNVSRIALEAKVTSLTSNLEAVSSKYAELEKKLESVESGGSGGSGIGDMSPEDLAERLEAIEKKLKSVKPAKPVKQEKPAKTKK